MQLTPAPNLQPIGGQILPIEWQRWFGNVQAKAGDFGTPTTAIGLTATTGVANTMARSDSAPALSQAIAPTWTGIHTWAPATDITPTVVKGSASQTAALTAWKNNSSTLLAEVRATGRIHTKQDFEVDDTFGMMSGVTARTYFFDAGVVNPSTNGWTVDQDNAHDGVISDGAVWKHYVETLDNDTPEYFYRTLPATPNSIQMNVGTTLTASDAVNGLNTSGFVMFGAIACTHDGTYVNRDWKAGLYFKSQDEGSGFLTLRLSMVFIRNEAVIEYNNPIVVKTLAVSDIPYSYTYNATIRVDQAGANVLKFYVNNVLVYTTVNDTHNNLTPYVGNGFARVSYTSGNYQTHTGYGGSYYAFAPSGMPLTESADAYLTKRSGAGLQVGDNNYWNSITYQVPGGGSHSFKANTTEYFGIGGSGDLTAYSLIGTGTRMMTATPTGVLGAATSVVGIHTWVDIQTFTAQPIMSTLTASLPVFSDASKGLVSNTMTGSGSVMMSLSPTTTGTLTGAIANFSDKITNTKSGAGSSSGFFSSSTVPFHGFRQTDGTADNQMWDVGAFGEQFLIRAINDASTVSANAIVIDRTGTTIDSVTFPSLIINSTLSASQAVFTNGSKGLVSNAITGTGNVVMSTSPTLTGTIGAANGAFSGTLGVTGVATFTAQPIFSSATVSTAAAFDASKGLISVTNTGTGNNVLSASPTFTGTIIATGATFSGTLTGTLTGSITGNAATVTTNANLTGPITSVGNATAVASQTGTGSTFVMSASPTITGTLAAASGTYSGNVDITGNIGVGGASNASFVINAVSTTLTGATQYGVVAHPTFTSAASASGISLYAAVITSAASFAMPVGIGLQIDDAAILGVGSSIGTQYGLKIENQTKGTTKFAIKTGTGPVSFGDNVSTSGTLTVTGASNVAGLTSSADMSVTKTAAGAIPVLSSIQTDNTSGASHARVQSSVGGPLGGDPYFLFTISSTLDWALGTDNSDSDAFVLSRASFLGTSNIQRWDAAGTTITGTTAISGAFGCNGAAAQTAVASGGALAAYGAGTNGFDTAAHASALYAMVVAIRGALVSNGIMS